uniref:AT18238p n=1 Tax=Drosophila melanogaster TaxID=7227 RepID=Q86NU3_DROME|nr:AT18238p [Drosophila melanogaster]
MSYQDMFGCNFDSQSAGRGSNFEFRFSGPESIPNAVRRYNAMRGAELAQMKRQREMGRSHVPSMPRFCKVRRPGQDVTSMVTSRDLDVVTQLSLDSDPICNDDNDNNDDNDDEEYVGSEPNDFQYQTKPSPRLCGGSESPRIVKSKFKGRKKQTRTSRKKNHHGQVMQQGHTYERLEELHREVCAELQTLGESNPVSPDATPRPKMLAKQQRTRTKKQRKTQDSWVDVDGSPAHLGQVSFEDYHKPQPNWTYILPSKMASQAIKVNVCEAQNASSLSAYEFMEQYGTVEPEPVVPFFLEDSDLEHEYADRQGYMRYVEPKPQYTSSDSDEDHRAGNTTHPVFVEMERQPHRLSLLKSLAPMRYTSQKSEETLRTQGQETQVPPSELSNAPPASRRGNQRTSVVDAGPKTSKPRRTNVLATGYQKNARTRRTLRAGGGDEPAAVPQSSQHPANPPNLPNPPKEVVTAPERLNRRRKPKPMVVYSKSLEDLKFEKLAIYNKITLTQERIINALDKLQTSLLHLQVPNSSAQERQKRQRNAFEFCVRFSRNFLYPLKGMIDDVRYTTVASFNSATSNEACQRVVCVYGLMQQSIQTYQRQLRYFLLEKVPQKLSALIEMIYTMTNCCLDKGMLDRQDPVVECLQERCTRFLSFIEDMQEERFKLAREAMRRLQKGHSQGNNHQSVQKHSKKRSAKPPRAPTQPRQEKLRSHERYDLKMCLNDRKLYEPRLVPKERQQPEKRPLRMRRPRNTQNVATTLGNPGEHANGQIEQPCDMDMQSLGPDDMQTQIQMTADVGTSSSVSLMPTVTYQRAHPFEDGQVERSKPPSRDEQLRRVLLDAFHMVSRSQVKQVLDPLMRSLGVILAEKTAKAGGVHQEQ